MSKLLSFVVNLGPSSRPGGTLVVTAAILVGLTNCAETRSDQHETSEATPPRWEFVDDYGIQYSISTEEWIQHENVRYHVQSWNFEQQFLIAQNDTANPSEPGLWTRIDWIPMEGTDGFEWAFCYAVYDAPSAAAADAARVTDRATPQTGCNGFPFSRMRPSEIPAR